MSFIYNKNNYKIIDAVKKERDNFVELEFLEITKCMLPNNPVILDIGANIGNHSIYYEKECGASKVISFEPIKPIFNTMLKNFELNNIKNNISFNVAISSKESDLKCISQLPNNYGSYWLWYENEKYKHPSKRGYVAHNGCDGSSYTDTIKSIPLSSIHDVTTLSVINLIKIDVEGMEFEVLKGSIDIIKYHNPLLQIEVAIDNNDIIYNMLSEIGYKRIKRDVFKNENQLWEHL